jgi:hypothetical protein
MAVWKWFENRPDGSVEQYEAMKVTCMEGLKPLLGSDEF